MKWSTVLAILAFALGAGAALLYPEYAGAFVASLIVLGTVAGLLLWWTAVLARRPGPIHRPVLERFSTPALTRAMLVSAGVSILSAAVTITALAFGATYLPWAVSATISVCVSIAIARHISRRAGDTSARRSN